METAASRVGLGDNLRQQERTSIFGSSPELFAEGSERTLVHILRHMSPHEAERCLNILTVGRRDGIDAAYDYSEKIYRAHLHARYPNLF